MTQVAVVAHDVLQCAAAELLAAQLHIPLLGPPDTQSSFQLLLEVRADGLLLSPVDPQLGKGLRIDFVSGATAYRRHSAGSTRQPLARAIGFGSGCRTVIDATAGLGRDSFLLACLGCRVTALERSPVLAAMLCEALERVARCSDPKLKEIADRISVLNMDSMDFLPRLASAERPDVVYLDPMYSLRNATALAKKEMRILRLLVGDDEDASSLLCVARAVATRRVVVKRHLRAAPLAPGAIHSHAGRSVRYDVYAPATE